MHDTWLDSYGSADPPLSHNNRNEAMFMVLATSSGYEIDQITPGPNTSSCKFDIDEPIQSNVVALIHTHPYSDGDTINDSRCSSGVYNGENVSSGDQAIVDFIDNSTTLPSILMYVIDKDKIRVIEPSNPSDYSQNVNRCGY